MKPTEISDLLLAELDRKRQILYKEHIEKFDALLNILGTEPRGDFEILNRLITKFRADCIAFMEWRTTWQKSSKSNT